MKNELIVGAACVLPANPAEIIRDGSELLCQLVEIKNGSHNFDCFQFSWDETLHLRRKLTHVPAHLVFLATGVVCDLHLSKIFLQFSCNNPQRLEGPL